MGIPNKIKVGGSTNDKKEYYYWQQYNSFTEATEEGKRIKKERKKEGINLKYYILETVDSWFLPIPIFVVYLNKKLRII